MSERAVGHRCAGCGRVFGGLSGFDAHRVGDFERGRMVGRGKRRRYVVTKPNTRRCMTDSELAAVGLCRAAGGRWSRTYEERSA